MSLARSFNPSIKSGGYSRQFSARKSGTSSIGGEINKQWERKITGAEYTRTAVALMRRASRRGPIIYTASLAWAQRGTTIIVRRCAYTHIGGEKIRRNRPFSGSLILGVERGCARHSRLYLRYSMQGKESNRLHRSVRL